MAVFGERILYFRGNSIQRSGRLRADRVVEEETVGQRKRVVDGSTVGVGWVLHCAHRNSRSPARLSNLRKLPRGGDQDVLL